MTDFFKNIQEIKYEGESSQNPLAFKYYDENKIVLGKSLKDHFRFATCYWHTFTWPGLDPFGGQTFDRPWMKSGDQIKMAEMKLDAAFEFFTKIKTPFFCFHDRDISPEGDNYKETQKNFLYIVDLMQEKISSTGIGNGFAIPHPKTPLRQKINQSIVGTFFLQSPLDFNSPDDLPVSVVFVLLSTDSVNHLQLLSQLVRLLNKSNVSDILNPPPSLEILIAKFEKTLAEKT